MPPEHSAQPAQSPLVWHSGMPPLLLPVEPPELPEGGGPVREHVPVICTRSPVPFVPVSSTVKVLPSAEANTSPLEIVIEGSLADPV